MGLIVITQQPPWQQHQEPRKINNIPQELKTQQGFGAKKQLNSSRIFNSENKKVNLEEQVQVFYQQNRKTNLLCIYMFTYRYSTDIERSEQRWQWGGGGGRVVGGGVKEGEF